MGTAPPRLHMEAELTRQEAAEPVAPAVLRAPPRPAPPKPKKPKRSRTPLEQRIGQNWTAWVGAIVIVVGASLAVKVVYDTGWWGSLSPLIRCLFVAGFGGLLVAAGELALRRIGLAASVGLFGAGLGVLYLDAFAAFQWFETAPGVPLVSQEWSFVLMGAVALLGFGITLRSDFLSIGVLSIVGGYLTPWLLGGGTTHVLEVGAYLTMLLGIALGLSAVRPQHFRPLRYVALVGQAVVGVGWALSAVGAKMWVTALVLSTIWWAMVLIEAVVAAMRRQSTYGNVVVSLLSTAWFVTIGCWVLADSQPPGFDWLGTFTVAVGVVAAAVAAQFGPPFATLARPGTAMAKLAIALWAQTGVLLTVAIALQFDGYGQSIGWLAIALASIEIGRRSRFRAVDIFGFVVGALAIGRVAFLDRELAVMRGQLLSFGQVSVTHWSILALAAIATTLAAARRLRDVYRAMPVILTIIAALGWLGLCVLQCDQLWTTGGWLLGGTVLVAAGRFGPRQRYLEIGLLALVATAGRWLVMDAVMRRADPAWDATASLPVLNWQMGLAVAIAGVGWWAARVLARRPSAATEVGEAGVLSSVGWQLALLVGAVLILVGLSFELDHAVEAMLTRGRSFSWSPGQLLSLLLTILWALGSAGLGVAARTLVARRPADALAGRRAPNLLARFAWSILAICAVKWLFGDTLYWALREPTGRTGGVLAVANLRMVAGVIVAASAVVLVSLTRAAAPPGAERVRPIWIRTAGWVPAAAALLVLWGLSFEIDRVIGGIEQRRGEGWSPWHPIHLRALWWTLLWGAGGLAMMLWTRLRPAARMIAAGWFVVVLAAVVWLGYDTVGWRFTDGVTLAPVVFNVQFMVGALLCAVLAAACWHWARTDAGAANVSPAAARQMGLALIGLIGLWLGSLEIDRFFAPEAQRIAANAAMARQTAWSIYWGLYAIATVAVGFAWRSAVVRYAGLALLAITLGKVLTVDMAEVRKIYRVLSFLGVGLLLVATSVGYSKLAPRLPSDTTDKT
ncbi:MAG: DUF2339 domain-containing protein [Planctomycetota bacterium]|jgi:uncharacterized membrane protein